MTNNRKSKQDKVTLNGRYNPLVLRKKSLQIVAVLFRYTLLICLGFVILIPILHTLKDAVTDQSALGLKNSVWVPPAISAQSFVTAGHILKFNKGILFSLGNTAVLALLQTLCASLAAYSFARLRFKGSNLLFGLVIFTIIVPSQSIMLAQYISFRNFDFLGIIKLITGQPINLVGSTVAIYILAATGMGVKGGLYIYILRQSYRQLPVSIEEAAYVDGAGFLKTFFQIVIPGVSASLTTVGVLSFVWNYSDVYFISLLSPTDLHLPLRLVRIQNNMRWAILDVEKLIPSRYIVQAESPVVQTAVASACAILVILPLLILYLFVQKRFVQGVERSGLGGD
ncbi:MAG: carbohydrate transporter permease [Herbinix sp.]|jgi:multiple sugar transport system permease protein|nr:carbohydrate transporter permease [Herbinix sp.]